MLTDPGAVAKDAEPIKATVIEMIPNDGDIDNDETHPQATSSSLVSRHHATPEPNNASPVPSSSKGAVAIRPRSCKKCGPQSFKPKRAHHCSICKR